MPTRLICLENFHNHLIIKMEPDFKSAQYSDYRVKTIYVITQKTSNKLTNSNVVWYGHAVKIIHIQMEGCNDLVLDSW